MSYYTKYLTTPEQRRTHVQKHGLAKTNGPTPRARQVYWVKGESPWPGQTVGDPPSSGYSLALLMQSGRPSTTRVLCPVTGRYWELPVDALELAVDSGSKWMDECTEKCLDALERLLVDSPYSTPDLDAVADFLRTAGRVVDEEALQARREATAGEPGHLSGNTTRVRDVDGWRLSSPIKAGSRRADVLSAFASGEPVQVSEVMSSLGMSRNSVLSHLWALKKHHGLDYTLNSSEGTATLVPGQAS